MDGRVQQHSSAGGRLSAGRPARAAGGDHPPPRVRRASVRRSCRRPAAPRACISERVQRVELREAALPPETTKHTFSSDRTGARPAAPRPSRCTRRARPAACLRSAAASSPAGGTRPPPARRPRRSAAHRKNTGRPATAPAARRRCWYPAAPAPARPPPGSCHSAASRRVPRRRPACGERARERPSPRRPEGRRRWSASQSRPCPDTLP